MNTTFKKSIVAFAIAATACISFARPEKPADGAMPHPPKMEERGRPHFDEETFKLAMAYRQEPTEANLEALKAKLASNYDARLAKQQARLDEMKAKRDEHLEAMLKRMTDPEFGPKKGGCPEARDGKKPRREGPKGGCPEARGPKGPRGEGPKGRHHHKGPRGDRKGPAPEDRGEAPAEVAPVPAE